MNIPLLAIITSLSALSVATAAPTTIRFSGETRACAGGVKDATHTISIRAQVGNALPVTFRLSNKDAFILDGKNSRETRTIRPDTNGKCSLEIRGGSHPTTPFLIAFQEGKEIGRMQLDFAPSSRYRRFADPNDLNSDEDEGMLFSRDGNTGKIYLKFRKSLHKGDVNGNWKPVAGHRILVSISQVDASTTLGKIITNPKQIARYGKVFDFKNPKAKKCIVTTRADGTAQFGFKDFNFDEYSTFQIDADDLTEGKGPKYYISPSAAKPQRIPNYGKKSSKPQWFARPTDLNMRLIWNIPAPKTKGISKWKWSDINGTKRSAERLLNIKDYSDVDQNTYYPIFSPDAKRVLIFRGREDINIDNAHDTVIADLQSGLSYLWRIWLFGASEKWSPDGKRVAFVGGSLDTLGPEPISPPLFLSTHETQMPLAFLNPKSQANTDDAIPNTETALLTDDGLEPDSLAWTKNGDLLAVTSTKSQRILRFKNGMGTGEVWKTNAYSPVPSPEGKHITFRGPEPDSNGKSRDRAQAINVADDSGDNTRTLTRIPDGETEIFITPDGQSAIVTKTLSYDELQESKTPTQVYISISEFNLQTGARRSIAELGGSRVQNYQDKFAFPMLGLSKNGKYLLLGHREVEFPKNTGHKTVANALHVIRLSDGKLIPIAVFNSEFAIAALK